MTKPTLAEAIETMDYFTECRGDSKHYVAWAVVKEAAENGADAIAELSRIRSLIEFDYMDSAQFLTIMWGKAEAGHRGLWVEGMRGDSGLIIDEMNGRVIGIQIGGLAPSPGGEG